MNSPRNQWHGDYHYPMNIRPLPPRDHHRRNGSDAFIGWLLVTLLMALFFVGMWAGRPQPSPAVVTPTPIVLSE